MMDIRWSDDQYEIRPAKDTNEFREVWWRFMQDLGWNRGYYDLDTYMNPSIGSGMLLLIEKKSGRPVGHVAAVINSNSTGWVSMFIIDEKHRGNGLGRELFKAAEADFRDMGTRFIGLDGVIEQKQTYERRHFVSSPLGTIRIMVHDLSAKDPVPESESNLLYLDVRDVPKSLLVQHELQHTGFERPALWSDEHLFNRQDVNGIAVVRSSPPETLNDLKAWAVTRRCSGGVRIGPLYASDVPSARAVLLAVMRSVSAATIKRVPLPNEEMNDWAEDRIAGEGSLVTEVWGGNAEAVKLFDELGWRYAGAEYNRMWVDGKAPIEQSAGGPSERGVYAIFDAAIG